MVGDLFEVWEIVRVSRCDVWISKDFVFMYFIVSRSLLRFIPLFLMRYSSAVHLTLGPGVFGVRGM